MESEKLRRLIKGQKVLEVLYFGDRVWFVQNWTLVARIPKDSIVYTLEEAQILAKRSQWTKRIVHEAKRLGIGAKVVKGGK